MAPDEAHKTERIGDVRSRRTRGVRSRRKRRRRRRRRKKNRRRRKTTKRK